MMEFMFKVFAGALVAYMEFMFKVFAGMPLQRAVAVWVNAWVRAQEKP